MSEKLVSRETGLESVIRFAHRLTGPRYHPYFALLDIGAVACSLLALAVGLRWTGERPWVLPLIASAVFYFPVYPAWLWLKHRLWTIEARSYLTDTVFVLAPLFVAATALAGVPWQVSLTYLGLCFPMAATFARIGCLLSGCCYGQPVRGHHSWLAVRYGPQTQRRADQWWRKVRVGESTTTAVHAVQVWDIAANLALLAVLAPWVIARTEPTPAALPAYLLGYAGTRFVLEPYRGHRHTSQFRKMSHAQVVCLIVVVISAAMLWGLYSLA